MSFCFVQINNDDDDIPDPSEVSDTSDQSGSICRIYISITYVEFDSTTARCCSPIHEDGNERVKRIN